MKGIKHSLNPPRPVIGEEVSQDCFCSGYKNAEPGIKHSISSLRSATKIRCSGEDPGEELIKLLEDKEEALSVV